MLAGTALAWSQLDAIQRDRVRSHTGGRTPVSVLRLVGGMVLVGLGIFLLVGRNIPLDDLLQTAIAALAVLIGAATRVRADPVTLDRVELAPGEGGAGQHDQRREHPRAGDVRAVAHRDQHARPDHQDKPDPDVGERQLPGGVAQAWGEPGQCRPGTPFRRRWISGPVNPTGTRSTMTS